ncbi:sensor histidine kinase [Chryseolinea lacunae]|uniref:histidine kinase n=1 Tax=Chryseolinea lacunae TaxID=2801331 RepID=A0ABS1KZW1_9BACT|nr:ATP-binding protein [Chryseolinea lacunae]MBL0744777.1 type IV pili methyl-accepting chemotaxis transducer N-terminal domain-containing protein [Chryseolinea lacunae]
MDLKFNPEHKPTLKFSRLGTWYILALSAIAIVSVVGQVLVQQHLRDQFSDSQVVNVAGRQRMLSQKISKTVLFLKDGQSLEKRSAIREDLWRATQLWKLSQEGLQNGNDSLHLPGHNSATVIALFSEISDPFLNIHKSAERIVAQLKKDLQAPMPLLDADVQTILQHEGRFLMGMDALVRQYAKEANEKIDSLRRMEYLLLFISLFVITLEVVFIFRPTAIQVSRTVNKLRASEKNSRKLLTEVGALYASLEKSYEQLSVINKPVENPRLFAKADKGGNVTFVSEAFAPLTEHHDGKGMRIAELFSGMVLPDDWMDEVVETVADGNAWQGELRFLDTTKKECWVSLIIQPVYDAQGDVDELLVLGSNMTERKLAEQNMNRKNRAEIEKMINQQKFRSVLILEGQEEERKRIAMDIHDGIGQMLTSLKYQIESIDVKESKNASQKISEVDHLIKDVIKEVRRVTFNLKPTVLGDYGLQAALKVFIHEIAKLTDIRLVYKTAGEMERLPQKIENNIFRIIQEAINNAIKYSGADAIEVVLQHNDSQLLIVVKDEGRGFDAKIVEARSVNIESGRGFFNMYERTEYVNGKLDIQSAPGQGTTVALTVPIRNPVLVEEA